MKIAFDGQFLLAGNKTGIPWYAHNIILELAKNPENECIIQCFSVKDFDKKRIFFKEYEELGCRVEQCKWMKLGLYKLVWNFFPVPYSIFFKTKPDISLFFNYVIPPGVKGRRITVIHDMCYKAIPETVNEKTRLWLETSLKKTCRRADYIITDSEFSKKEIIKYLGVEADKISVVYCAVNHSVYNTDYTKEQITPVLAKYGINGEYILYLGTIEPRKNLKRLVEAYKLVLEKDEEAPTLVLAGGRGWLCDDIFETAQELVEKGKIIFTGYVEDDEAPKLMCGAKAFVFPSLYEGFGMPPLEAMACGTPVVVSNEASLPEVVGDAGVYVDAYDVESIAKGICSLIKNEQIRFDLGIKAAGQVNKFMWVESARSFENIFKKMV